MAKVSTYRLENYGVPAGAVVRPGGLFQLSDAGWHLLFPDPGSGVGCGLLRSQVEVEDFGRRRCQVTVKDDREDGFHATFVLRAGADNVRTDLGDRLSSLDRSGEVIAAVESGQWWRDVRVFDQLGWSRTRSIAGVRCKAGQWGTIRAKPALLARVLDFGPNGVSLRGWRTRLVVPWEEIAAIRVTDGQPQSAAHVAPDRRRFSGADIVLRSHRAEELVFHTMLLTRSEIEARLSSLINRLVRASVGKARAVPELTS